MKHQLRTIVVGAGNMGKNHARLLSQLSNLVGVVDTNQSRAQAIAKQHHTRAFTKLSQCLTTTKPQAAVVAVPTKYHLEITQQLLQKQIPTLVEKPIASTSKQGKVLLSLAEQQNTFLMVGHIERFNPAIQQVKQLLKDQAIGQLIQMLSIRVGISPPSAKNADVALDLGIHDIDIFNHLVEAFPQDTHITKHQLLSTSSADSASIILDYGHVSGLIQTNWLTPIKQRKLYLTGTEGYLEVDYIKQQVTLYDRLLNLKPAGDFYELINKFDTTSSQVFVSQKEPLKQELIHFLTNAQTTPDFTLTRYAIKAVEILETT